MIKSLIAAFLVLAPIPALAIAPGVEQANYCANYTADRFRLTINDVSITNFRQSGSNYRVSWTIPNYRGRGYCIVSKYNKMVQYRVEKEPQNHSGHQGPNEKRFNNLPGYGNVIVNRGQVAIGDKQYFLVRSVQTGRSYKWYARCANNSDQVYDHRGKYVGYNRQLSVMFPYVCEFSSISSNNRPGRPQPR